jgi:hypothetical protein
MPDIQYIIVALLIAAAFVFAARSVYRRARSFSAKSGCDADCGCGSKSKKLSS